MDRVLRGSSRVVVAAHPRRVTARRIVGLLVMTSIAASLVGCVRLGGLTAPTAAEVAAAVDEAFDAAPPPGVVDVEVTASVSGVGRDLNVVLFLDSAEPAPDLLEQSLTVMTENSTDDDFADVWLRAVVGSKDGEWINLAPLAEQLGLDQPLDDPLGGMRASWADAARAVGTIP